MRRVCIVDCGLADEACAETTDIELMPLLLLDRVAPVVIAVGRSDNIVKTEDGTKYSQMR